MTTITLQIPKYRTKRYDNYRDEYNNTTYRTIIQNKRAQQGRVRSCGGGLGPAAARASSWASTDSSSSRLTDLVLEEAESALSPPAAGGPGNNKINKLHFATPPEGSPAVAHAMKAPAPPLPFGGGACLKPQVCERPDQG